VTITNRVSLKSVEAGITPIDDVPDAPTIGTATVTNATTVSLTFTAAATGGAPTSYTVVASPSVGNISTAAGTTSPLTVTGTFVANTSYTFTVRANNSTASSAYSLSSNAITPNPTYALSQTFNASGTYTVPEGTTKIALVGVGAGGGGGAGNSAVWNSSNTSGGGGGGGGGGLFIIREISVTPGTTHTVTVGALGVGGYVNHNQDWRGNSGSAGGQSLFGNILIANGGGGGSRIAEPDGVNGLGGGGGTVVYNTGTADVSATGATGATGNRNSSFPVYTTPAGGSGGNSSTATSNDANIPSYSGGGAGGSASSPLMERYNNTSYNGAGAAGTGGTPYGGAGGRGGNILGAVGQSGNRGANATGKGGGGGGGGGLAFAGNGNETLYYFPAPSANQPHGVGGYGSDAQILVYAK